MTNLHKDSELSFLLRLRQQSVKPHVPHPNQRPAAGSGESLLDYGKIIAAAGGGGGGALAPQLL